MRVWFEIGVEVLERGGDIIEGELVKFFGLIGWMGKIGDFFEVFRIGILKGWCCFL